MTCRVLSPLAIPLLLAGCFGGSEPESVPDSVQKAALVAPAASGSGDKTPGVCPLTLPNGDTPPGEPDIGANHGNGELWTALWPDNVVIARPHFVAADGSVVMKWPWWWHVRGTLRITGHRLDGRAPPLTASVTPGYEHFQPSAIRFPTGGCWEVTGAAGDAKLRFVTLVLKAARYWPVAESK